MDKKRILLLGRRGTTTNIVFNHLDSRFGISLAVTEGKEDTAKYLKRRIRKLGLMTVLGQIGFRLTIPRLLSYFSTFRRNEIFSLYELNAAAIPPGKEMALQSVNSEAAIQAIREFAPDLIVINGTRILSRKLLSQIDCRILNIHAGITPKYRGVHGMYWSLVNRDPQHCGVTVHFVDEGVDTGGIVGQRIIKPSSADDFSTYSYLQLSEGLSLLTEAIMNHFQGSLRVSAPIVTESRQWYHPTLWGYVYNRLVKGVR